MKRFIFIFAFLFLSLGGIAQGPPGGGGNGGPCDNPNPPSWCNNKGCYPPLCIPVGGSVGFSLLVLGGAGMGYRFLIKYKKNHIFASK